MCYIYDSKASVSHNLAVLTVDWPPFPGLYWISSDKAFGLPAVEVHGNKVVRATFGDITLGGRRRNGKFVTSFDNKKYITESCDVSFTHWTFMRTKLILDAFLRSYTITYTLIIMIRRRQRAHSLTTIKQNCLYYLINIMVWITWLMQLVR